MTILGGAWPGHADQPSSQLFQPGEQSRVDRPASDETSAQLGSSGVRSLRGSRRQLLNRILRRKGALLPSTPLPPR